MLTPAGAGDDIVAMLASRHGLALTSLFPGGRHTEAGGGTHAVLLDGPRGSFAVSSDIDVDPTVASSWIWSSNLAHHVLIGRDDVHVTRWDRPGSPLRVAKGELESRPDHFFELLRNDLVSDARTVVAHSVGLFRRVRNIVRQAGLDDACATTAYLTLLASLTEQGSSDHGGYGHLGRDFDLPHGYADVVRRLPERMVDATLREFSRLQVDHHALQAHPVLAMRHASGAIFQEAHHTLSEDRQLDLLDEVAPARSKGVRRGVVHFTPPPLARGLADQALGRLSDLHRRPSLVIADITCGSGAFLIECLRGLERMRYAGHVTVCGRDVSPAAIDMARFAVGLATAEWPGKHRSRTNIAVGDTLRGAPGFSADVMVMNPPFLSWANQNRETRDALRQVLGSAWAGRPDVSTGFVLRAVDALRPDGALAALVPASTLETKAGGPWRDQLTARHRAGITARFDNLSIFPHATVRLGAIVLGGDEAETLEVRSGSPENAVGDVLRALRRNMRGDDGAADRPPTWTIRSRGSTLRLSAGQPTSDQAWWVGARRTVRVDDLFTIRQGIRSGCDEAFILTQAQHRALPEGEQAAFRPAITSDAIADGRAATRVMVFFPYAPPWDDIVDEAGLRARVPTYTALHLMPRRDRLRDRLGFEDRWWRLTRPRQVGSERDRPLFVMKYFAGPGGVALDAGRDALVVQGFGWTPKQRASELLGGPWRKTVPAPVFAYLAILNSRAFFEIVSAHSNSQRGGQLDMSHRYVAAIPLIDLARVEPEEMQSVADLATLGRALHLGEAGDLPAGAHEVAEWAVKALYRPDLPEFRARRQAGRTPVWLSRFLLAEENPKGEKQRVDVLVDLRQRAKAGAFAEIDEALREVVPDSLNDYALNTLLRGTFAMRLHLPYWTTFRDRAAEVFAKRGRNLEAVMVGLYR